MQNIIMPLLVRGMTTQQAEEQCKKTIELLGISHRLKHKPNELSGGQKQRVSIARALVGEPALLLADEPTGALDSASGKEVLKLFEQLHEMGHTIVMITHDLSVAKACAADCVDYGWTAVAKTSRIARKPIFARVNRRKYCPFCSGSFRAICR